MLHALSVRFVSIVSVAASSINVRRHLRVLALVEHRFVDPSHRSTDRPAGVHRQTHGCCSVLSLVIPTWPSHTTIGGCFRPGLQTLVTPIGPNRTTSGGCFRHGIVAGKNWYNFRKTDPFGGTRYFVVPRPGSPESPFVGLIREACTPSRIDAILNDHFLPIHVTSTAAYRGVGVACTVIDRCFRPITTQIHTMGRQRAPTHKR